MIAAPGPQRSSGRCVRGQPGWWLNGRAWASVMGQSEDWRSVALELEVLLVMYKTTVSSAEHCNT